MFERRPWTRWQRFAQSAEELTSVSAKMFSPTKQPELESSYKWATFSWYFGWRRLYSVRVYVVSTRLLLIFRRLSDTCINWRLALCRHQGKKLKGHRPSCPHFLQGPPSEALIKKNIILALPKRFNYLEIINSNYSVTCPELPTFSVRDKSTKQRYI